MLQQLHMRPADLEGVRYNEVATRMLAHRTTTNPDNMQPVHSLVDHQPPVTTAPEHLLDRQARLASQRQRSPGSGSLLGVSCADRP